MRECNASKTLKRQVHGLRDADPKKKEGEVERWRGGEVKRQAKQP